MNNTTTFSNAPVLLNILPHKQPLLQKTISNNSKTIAKKHKQVQSLKIKDQSKSENLKTKKKMTAARDLKQEVSSVSDQVERTSSTNSTRLIKQVAAHLKSLKSQFKDRASTENEEEEEDSTEVQSNLSETVSLPEDQSMTSEPGSPFQTKENQKMKMERELNVQRIEYLPNLPTSLLIEQGKPVTIKAHIRDVLLHYDVVAAPRDFLQGLMLPEKGRFFRIEPENKAEWWSQKASQYPFLKRFVY